MTFSTKLTNAFSKKGRSKATSKSMSPMFDMIRCANRPMRFLPIITLHKYHVTRVSYAVYLQSTFIKCVIPIEVNITGKLRVNGNLKPEFEISSFHGMINPAKTTKPAKIV